jgi:hypothetical protein
MGINAGVMDVVTLEWALRGEDSLLVISLDHVIYVFS